MDVNHSFGRAAIYTHLQRVKVVAVAKGIMGEQHQHMQDIPNDDLMRTIQQLRTNGYIREAQNEEWSFFLVPQTGHNFFAIHTRERISTLSQPAQGQFTKLEDIITEETVTDSHSTSQLSISTGLHRRNSDQGEFISGEVDPHLLMVNKSGAEARGCLHYSPIIDKSSSNTFLEEQSPRKVQQMIS